MYWARKIFSQDVRTDFRVARGFSRRHEQKHVGDRIYNCVLGPSPTLTFIFACRGVHCIRYYTSWSNLASSDILNQTTHLKILPEM